MFLLTKAVPVPTNRSVRYDSLMYLNRWHALFNIDNAGTSARFYRSFELGKRGWTCNIHLDFRRRDLQKSTTRI
jgi:hypothetical protein